MKAKSKNKNAVAKVKIAIVKTPSTSSKVDAAVILQSLIHDAAPHLKKVRNIVLKDKKDYDKAVDLMKLAKTYAKMGEEKEKSLTAPLLQVIGDIRLLFKPFKNEVEQVERELKIRMLQFNEANKVKILKLEEKFESGDIKKVSTIIKHTNELIIDSNIRKVWTAIPVNAMHTPREYLVPDETAIKAALKAGKVVKGWKWEQVEQIAI